MDGQEKRKRGRPPAFADVYHQTYKNTWPDIRTRRGMTNKIYSINGLEFIKGLQGMEYIFNEADNTMKVSILTELGRLNDEQAAREAASFICEREAAGDHRTAHEWAAIVRKYRISETVSDNSGGGLQHDE